MTFLKKTIAIMVMMIAITTTSCYYDDTPPEYIAQAESFVNFEVYDLASDTSCTALFHYSVTDDSNTLTIGKYISYQRALKSDANGSLIAKVYLQDKVNVNSLKTILYCDIDGNGIFDNNDKAMLWESLPLKKNVNELIYNRTQNFLAKATITDFEDLTADSRSDSDTNAQECVYIPAGFVLEFQAGYTQKASDFIHYLSWGASEGGSKNIYRHPDLTVTKLCRNI